MADPILRLRGLSKSYGDNIILDRIDLNVRQGEKVAVIGPSGSGKSTLLRLIMTLEPPDAGSIEVDGDDIWTMTGNGGQSTADEAHLRMVRRKIGMVFQQFNLFPHMTALENITCAPRLVLGKTKDEAEIQARDLLAMIGLPEKADAYPSQLSGGQKQRIAIVRALAMEPKIMLFDEITSALDPELVGEALNVLRDLASREDMTMIFVTHQMHFARDISDRVLFFDGGRIVEQGEPGQIFTSPDSPRLREFLRLILEAD